MIEKFTRFSRTKTFEYILLALILIAGFGLRLYKINNPIADWHSWRQADTASVSKIYAEKGINLLYPRYHDVSSIQTGKPNPEGWRMVEFPIYNALSALVSKSFSSFSLEVWSRVFTAAFAVVSAFFLYLLGKRYVNTWGGILSAFFYLFIPFNIYFTRVILPDPMGVMFGVIALWFFSKFIDSGKDPFLLLSALFFSLMVLIKPYYAFYLVPMAFLAVDKYGWRAFITDRKLLFKTFVFFLVSFAPFLVWRAWEAKFPEGIPFYKWAFNGSRIRFKPSFWYWIFGERLGHLILGSLGVVPFVFGILNAKVKSLFVHWFLFGSLLYVIAVASANVMHDYYQIPIIPSLALALAAGSVFLWNQKVFDKTLTRTILVFSIAVMLVTGWNKIVGNYAVNRPEILEAGARVDALTPKDALIIAPYNGDTAFLYATKRSGWPAIENSIDNIIERGADYYVSVSLFDPDTKMMIARFKTIERTDKYIIIDLSSPLAD